MQMVPDLSVVIPTRNERDNIFPLMRSLRSALKGIRADILVIDDSDDATPQMVAKAAKAFQNSRFHIHIIHREPGEARAGGLATAVTVGLYQAEARYVAILDADLQHPPQHLRSLYRQAVNQDVDVAIATRYLPGGSYEGLDGPMRRWISVGLKWVAKIAFPDQLLGISDPLGGFFLIRRELLNDVTLRPIGYKISLELLVRCRWSNVTEMPYHFRARANGQSKSDIKQGLLVLQHMLRLICEVPNAARFWKFCFIGGIGAIINLTVLSLALNAHTATWLAWFLGTEVSVFTNFFLHELVTRRDTIVTKPVAPLLQRFASYHTTVGISICCTGLLFILLVPLLHVPLLAQGIALLGGTALYYWAAKRHVFSPSLRPFLPLRSLSTLIARS